MKRTAVILFLFALLCPAVTAQSPDLLEIPEPGDGRIRYAKGYYMTNIDGEDVKMIVLNEVTCFPPLKFKNKKQEEFYWRTVRDVKKTLPYAKLICETIFKQYKPVLKKFTKSQAQMLIKLIKRETNQSSYNIIKAFLGSFRAGFWQTFGRFFGVNLKGDYRPDKNNKDAIIERVAVAVELGTI